MGSDIRACACSRSPEPPRGAGFRDRREALVEGDRFTVAVATEQAEHPFRYMLFAVVAVAVPSVLFRQLYHGDAHRCVFGEVMYASIAFWWMIVPGWLAYKRGWLVPFPTLFRTFRDLERRAPLFTTVLASGLSAIAATPMARKAVLPMFAPRPPGPSGPGRRTIGRPERP